MESKKDNGASPKVSEGIIANKYLEEAGYLQMNLAAVGSKEEINIIARWLQIHDERARAEAIGIVDHHWCFDDNQKHLSTWHDKQDCLEALRAGLGEGT